jgi:putative endonuclease
VNRPSRTAGGATGVAVGSEKEQVACLYLEGRGLRLVARNYRCRHGELDLVMRDDNTLVFVEVRFRHSTRFGGAAESVDAHKQQRLAAAAGHYLQRHPSLLACRFDVLAIGAGDHIDWIKDAFNVEW